jgi:hypothetical protein
LQNVVAAFAVVSMAAVTALAVILEMLERLRPPPSPR